MMRREHAATVNVPEMNTAKGAAAASFPSKRRHWMRRKHDVAHRVNGAANVPARAAEWAAHGMLEAVACTKHWGFRSAKTAAEARVAPVTTRAGGLTRTGTARDSTAAFTWRKAAVDQNWSVLARPQVTKPPDRFL